MQHDIPEVVPGAGEIEAFWTGNLVEAQQIAVKCFGLFDVLNIDGHVVQFLYVYFHNFLRSLVIRFLKFK